MKKLKYAITIILVLSLAAILAACGSPKREPIEIIEEMVWYHGNDGEEADEKVEELLKELKKSDRESAEKWTEIMNLWKSEEAGIKINYSVLPDGLSDTDELAIVALGFQLKPDGTMKDELLERLKVVKKSAEKYPNAYVVCTGGGTAAENPSATEAGVMAAWLIENGIDEERIIVEDNSITTAQNAIFSLDILEEKYPQVSQIAIVSSDYHIATGELLFGAEARLRTAKDGEAKYSIVSNAAWEAPKGTLSSMFQAGALIELAGDKEKAFDIYYETYDIHELPPLN